MVFKLLFYKYWKIFLISLPLLIAGCNNKSYVEIVVYNPILNPLETFDAIVTKMYDSGFVDSVKIYGCPFTEGKIVYKLDYDKLKYYDLSVTKTKAHIDTFIETHSFDEIAIKCITNNTGKNIPISGLAEFRYISVDYKPDIFIPKPEKFIYKDKNAVKIVLYCNSKKRKELIAFLQNNIGDIFFMNGNQTWEYEIIN